MKTNIKLPILALILLIAVGCSNDEGFKSPIASSSDQTSTTQDLISYDGMLIQLPEGWEIVRPGQTDALDTPRNRSGSIQPQEEQAPSMTCVSQRVNRDEGGLVQYNWSGCWIPPNALPRNRIDIEVCVDPLQAICEFGPHGTLFNSLIFIRIDFQYLGLDRLGIDLQRDVAIYYVQDNGELLIMPHSVDWTGHALVGTTDHFSRYIVTRRIDS